MALKLSARAEQSGGNQVTVYLDVTPSGSYTVGGDTLDLTGILNPFFLAKPSTSRVPLLPPGLYLEEMNGIYTGIIEGTTLATYKMKFYTAGGSEFAAATYASQGITLANFNSTGTTGMKLIIVLVFPTGT